MPSNKNIICQQQLVVNIKSLTGVKEHLYSEDQNLMSPMSLFIRYTTNYSDHL